MKQIFSRTAVKVIDNKERKGIHLLLIVVISPPARVPAYSVDVVHGIPPLEHLVVIQDASTGKHVCASSQWPG